jgi:hypothetical protein
MYKPSAVVQNGGRHVFITTLKTLAAVFLIPLVLKTAYKTNGQSIKSRDGSVGTANRLRTGRSEF